MSESPEPLKAEKKNHSSKKSKGAVWYALAIVFGFIVLAALYGTTQNTKSRGHGGVDDPALTASANIDDAYEDGDGEIDEEKISMASPSSGDEAQAPDDSGEDGNDSPDEEETVPFKEDEAEDTGDGALEDALATGPENADAAAEPESAPVEEMVDSELLRLAAPRILGNPDAPLKIEEFSSLTCSHCGDFHRTTFKKLKEEYIDTGKAYVVFSDFPLNAPAIFASMAARCVADDERYFSFIQLLFETQEDWSYKPTYMTNLKQNAMLAGLSEDAFTKCMENTDLQMTLLQARQDAAKKYGLQATPSFVLNGEKVLSGAQPYEKFKEAFDAELARVKAAE